MHVNPIYKAMGREKRQYRKYAPWIFFIAELILIFEILYTADLIVSLGNFFLFIFIGVTYFRVNKLFAVLNRQKNLKDSQKMKRFYERKIEP